MKTSEILFQTAKTNNKETPGLFYLGKVLKFVLIIFMLSCITLMSSCVVAVRTPRYDTNGVVIEHHAHHFRGERHNRVEHHDHDQRKD
jgi:hypothetical protein